MVRQSIYDNVVFSFHALGDQGLVIKADDVNHVRKIAPYIGQIDKKSPIIDLMVTLESLVIIYDAYQCDFAKICDLGDDILQELHHILCQQHQKNIYRLPIYYHHEGKGDYAQDFMFLCDELSLSPTELIANHSNQKADILMIGFQPGFLHAGMMSDEWNIARATYIKPKISAGTVCVAICQSVITTMDTPTGWHVIGQTPFLNFSLNRQPPITIKAGDELRYQPINYDELLTLKDKFAHGEICLESMADG